MKRNILRFAMLFGLCTALGTASCSESDSNTDDPGEKPVDKTLTDLRIEPGVITLTAGETSKLTLQATPADADLSVVRWTSKQPEIATVTDHKDGTATVTALAEGNTTITAAYLEIRATCSVTVNAAPIPLEGIEITPSTLSLSVGKETDLTAKLVPENADVAGSVVWSSKDPSVATIDANGHVKALKVGNTELAATLGDISATCAIEVFDYQPKRTFTFYQFNIWEGLRNINNGLDAFINQLVALKPDAASFCEFPSAGDAERILSAAVKALKERTGVTYDYTFRQSSNGTRGLLTRHKILETDAVPSGNNNMWFYRTTIDFYGQEMALYASHAFHSFYACYLPRGYGDGESPYGWNEIYKDEYDNKSEGVVNDMLKIITDVDFILEREERSGRTKIATDLIADVGKQKAAGRLAIFGGDLNQPSHLDWTEATKDNFQHNGCVVPWPISTYVLANGMKDAYRTIYPDPVTHPATTWPVYNKDTQKETKWAEAGDERDRIDYVYYQPDEKIAPIKAQLVGPAQMKAESRVVRTLNGTSLETKIEDKIVEDSFVNKAEELIEPVGGIWPSDHRGLFITFEIQFPNAQ